MAGLEKDFNFCFSLVMSCGRSNRGTKIAEQERVLQQAKQAERERLTKEAREKEALNFIQTDVQQQLELEAEAARLKLVDDDDDNMNDEEEHLKWKVRVFLRF